MKSRASFASPARIAPQPSPGASRRAWLRRGRSNTPLFITQLFMAPLCAALLAGCATGPEHFGVQVQVRGEGGTPVAGAQIRARGDYLGTTDTLGLALLQIPGIAGDRVPVTLTCPKGFVSRSTEAAVVLSAPSSGNVESVPSLDLACQPEQREAVVLVHASGDAASLPVKVDGVVVGQTDSLGFAHVHVRATPASSFEVALDTTENERLVPANPTQTFRLESRDEVFVFDTAFETSKARKSKRGGIKRKR